MQLRDGPDRFGAVSVVLHWAVACLVILMLGIALYAAELPRDAGRPLRFLHMSFGLLLLPVALARAWWRVRSGKPATRHHNAVERALAGMTWRLLLLIPLVLLATGPFLAWLHERPVGFFGLFEFPSPVPDDHELRARLVMPIHSYAGYLLGVGIVLHAAGALKHLVVYRDGVADRMLRPFRNHTPEKEDKS